MTVFINEFHYDNDGADIGEFIEIAGLAGTDLTGWSLVLYNGEVEDAAVAYFTRPLTGVLEDSGNGYGYLAEFIPGIQNGRRDGFALVDDNGNVVEFLSYEGSLTAVDGPAAGLTSIDVGVFENPVTDPNGLVGKSISRIGIGTLGTDFAFQTAVDETPGETNAGQTLVAPRTVFINEFHYDNEGADVGEFVEIAGVAGTDLTGWSLVLYNGEVEDAGVVYFTRPLSGVLADSGDGFGYNAQFIPGLQNGRRDGFALVDAEGTVVEFLSYEGTMTAADGPAAGLTSIDVGVFENPVTDPDGLVGKSISRIGTGSNNTDFVWQTAVDDTPGMSNTDQTLVPTNTVFINEFHYDNEGADVGEFVEIAGVAGTDLTGWSLVLYNGQDFGAAVSYFTRPLSGVLQDAGDGYGYVAEFIPGIQNGRNDGFALVDAEGNVVQFLSYEGTMTAADGPAAGMTSVDVGVFENPVTDPDGLVGKSISLVGIGTSSADFVWQVAVDDTPGAENTAQQLTAPAPETFVLELLHFTDQEANAATINNIDNLSAVLNALRDEDLGNDGVADNTLTLSSGDAIIPGLFFDASEAVFGSAGIADIQIQNELGVQAIALGNHEFDLGTAFLAGLIDGSAPGDFSALSGTALDGQDFEGALFPYLSANLGFDTDPNLAPLEVAGGQDTATLTNVVTSSSVSDVNGELVGIVGATVPTIDSISSAGSDIGIFPEDFDSNPTPEQLDALAAILQAEVDQLLTDNPELNKVILLSHMQQISIEQGLAERLTGVDIIVAGGSNTRLFDENDRARDGDSAQGIYPTFVTNAGGTTTAVVNTDGTYKYVGRLVIEFDADGNIVPESYDAEVSGAYATDDQGVADLGAEGLVDAEVDAITDAIQAQIVATESNVFGVSDVFLNGNRSGTFTADDPDGVRTQETNLGNLTADANLAYANQLVAERATVDDDLGGPVQISIKNGGGIRASIGETVVPAGGSEAVRQPNSPSWLTRTMAT